MTGERENLHGGGTLLRRTSVFTRGENFGAGGIDFCRALKSLAITKKKDTLFSVSFFLEPQNSIDGTTFRSALKTKSKPSTAGSIWKGGAAEWACSDL